MSNKLHISKHWFACEKYIDEKKEQTAPSVIGKVSYDLPSLPPNELLESFSPRSFLIPDWHGEGIISKAALNIKNCLHLLWHESQAELKKFSHATRILKQSVYDEFLAYLATIPNKEAFENHEMLPEGPNEFWSKLLEAPQEKSILDEFFKIYSFRVVTVYLYKIRFLVNLADTLNQEIAVTNILNPSAFLSKIFRHGSKDELFCDALFTGPYSWYRPSNIQQEKIVPLLRDLKNTSITEMMKICTYAQVQSEKQNKSPLKFDDSEYSHSISHKSFGLFLNKLLIFLPSWLNHEESNHAFKNYNYKNPALITCKYIGSKLSSFSLSHWLAQEHNLQTPWQAVLSPEFCGTDFFNGTFIKACHELQFLTLLTSVAKSQALEPISFLAQICKERYQTTNELNIGSLFTTKSLDRVILHIPDHPKKNPHHYLLAQINAHTQKLNVDGHAIILTNQKIFVPSHSDKVEQLIKNFKIEAFIDMTQLKGKGEIPDYIYILKKQPPVFSKSNQEDFTVLIKKDSCLIFNFAGILGQFNKFALLLIEFEKFIQDKLPTCAIYHKEIEKNISFSFHQNAICDGRLLHSNDNDNAQRGITHPSFFANIAKNCIPLESYFQIETITHTDQENNLNLEINALLSVNKNRAQNYPLILVIDRSKKHSTRLEIIPSSNYLAKVESCGIALFDYFGLVPKISGLNPNLFREYFNSVIGNQLIQLSTSGKATKLKAKISGLMVPRFFSRLNTSDSNLKIHQFVKNNPKEILSYSPENLEHGFNEALVNLKQSASADPWETLESVAIMRHNIDLAISMITHSEYKKAHNCYTNQFFMQKLATLKTHPAFPNNPDIFFEHKKNDGLITGHKITQTQDISKLVIFDKDQEILDIHGDKVMLEFVEFILKRAYGMRINSLLASLHIPKLNDLKELFTVFYQINNILKTHSKELHNLANHIIVSEISKRK